MRYRLVCLIAVAFFSINAMAQQRTFVSSTGVDTNPCNRTSPCRTFNAAVAVTVSGGEVIALDSAGYGPASVTQSVSLIAPAGVYAGITVTSGTGILVDAPDIIVTIRGLNVNGLGGTVGIWSQVSAQLHVENCVVSGFSSAQGYGITASGSGSTTTVRDCEVRNNHIGIGQGSGMTTSIDHTRMDNNDRGTHIIDGRATIRDSVFFGGMDGLLVTAASINPEVAVENCLFTELDNGVSCGALPPEQPIVRLSSTMITKTTTGVNCVNFVSFGNNRFAGNGTDGTISTTIPLK
jgi:parallel beta helix pectate lyase-like protein